MPSTEVCKKCELFYSFPKSPPLKMTAPILYGTLIFHVLFLLLCFLLNSGVNDFKINISCLYQTWKKNPKSIKEKDKII